MKRIALLALALSAVAGAALAAQFYRWVDEKGNVEWRDTPPPPGAKKVEQRRIGVSTIQTSDLPYSVRLAVKNFPVTLWAFNCGAPCDQARAHLARRGVPHTEKDPQSDLDNFKKLTGGTEVPVLYVGSTRIKGYLESAWDSALDVAGYPRTPSPGARPVAKPASKPVAEQKAAPEQKPAAPEQPAPAAPAPGGGAAPQPAAQQGGYPAGR